MSAAYSTQAELTQRTIVAFALKQEHSMDEGMHLGGILLTKEWVFELALMCSPLGPLDTIHNRLGPNVVSLWPATLPQVNSEIQRVVSNIKAHNFAILNCE